MEVILREDVAHLGHIGDIVRVKPGYARNYLLPRGLAVVADKRNVKRLEHEQRVVAEKRERIVKAARSEAEKIAAVRVTVVARAGEEGKLFGSVTNADLETALSEQGITVERRRIKISEPIKRLGEHKASVHLGAGVHAEFAVVVEPLEPVKMEQEAGEGEPEKAALGQATPEQPAPKSSATAQERSEKAEAEGKTPPAE
jgi:large subunit ribosomal protein L9